jgi:mannosyltransferase
MHRSLPRRLASWTSHVGDSIRCCTIVLTVIAFGGLAVRFYHLSDRSLWFDEAFSWRLIQFPLLQMIQRVGRDNHPPLYFILLKAWAAVFGDSPLALRSLSVLLSCATVCGVYLFAAAAFGPHPPGPHANTGTKSRQRGIGLLAAALVAVSSFQIRYSWEVRMYALAAALTVFASWALFRCLCAPSRIHRWLIYGLCALLLAYTHYFALFTLAAQGVFVVAYLLVRADWDPIALLRSPALRHALLVALLVTACWLPWLPVFLRQRAQVQEAFWCRSVTAWDGAQLCYHIFAMPEYSTPPSRQQQLIAADLCILGLWVLRRGARAGDWYVLWSAIAPLLFCLLVSQYDTKVFSLRYFVMGHLFLLVGLAVLVWRVRFPLERSLIAIVLLAASAVGYADLWQIMNVANRPGAAGAAEFIYRHRKPGEPVVVCSPLFYFSILYHAPDRSDHYLYMDGRPIVHYEGAAALVSEDLIVGDQLQSVRTQRIWVVDMASAYWGMRSVPVPPQWTAKKTEMFADVFGIGNYIVVEYEVPQDKPPKGSVVNP